MSTDTMRRPVDAEEIIYNALLRADLERHARPDGARGYCNKCGSFPDTDTYNELKRRFPMNLMRGFLYRHRGGWLQKLPFVGVYFTCEYWKR
jgi:hypothetical protein